VAVAVGRALQAGAELVALGGRVDAVGEAAEQAADAVLRQVGAVLGPVGLHHPDLGRLLLDQEPALQPELAHHRPHLVGRLLHHQPALGAEALEAHVLDLRQHAGGAWTSLLLALLLVARERRRFLIGQHEAAVALRRGEVGRNLERRKLGRGLVVDAAVEHRGAAAREGDSGCRGEPAHP
jgi:hypothetical protein